MKPKPTLRALEPRQIAIDPSLRVTSRCIFLNRVAEVLDHEFPHTAGGNPPTRAECVAAYVRGQQEDADWFARHSHLEFLSRASLSGEFEAVAWCQGLQVDTALYALVVARRTKSEPVAINRQFLPITRGQWLFVRQQWARRAKRGDQDVDALAQLAIDLRDESDILEDTFSPAPLRSQSAQTGTGRTR